MTTDDIQQTGTVRTVTVTGTRTTRHRRTEDYRRLFAAYLGPFAGAGTRFYLGGAPGIDTLALCWLAEETPALITVAVPCTVADQPPDARHAIQVALEAGRVDELVELAAPALATGAYHARNRWMVDRSVLVAGFPHGDNPASGTWYALGFAAEQGKPRLIVPV